MRESLTPTQRRCIWLGGSFHEFTMVQGQGVRGKEQTLYALDEDLLIIFAYQGPLYFLERRGLLTRTTALTRLGNFGYKLSATGQKAFDDLLARDAGMDLNEQIRKVRLKT